MKKILLVSGHTPADVRGQLCGGEGKLNVELVNMITPYLAPYCDLTVYPAERDLYKDLCNSCTTYNLADFDYVLEIHFNASNKHDARGTNIQLHSGYKGGISVEQAIIDTIASFGFKKRGNNGITRRNDLLIMNTCLKKGIDHALLETCFGDNEEDMKIYQSNKSAIAKAIADAIISAFGLVLSKKTGTVVNCSRLNVRQTPNGSIATSIPAGTVVDIVGADPDSDGDMWHKIQRGNITGYIWPKYIR